MRRKAQEGRFPHPLSEFNDGNVEAYDGAVFSSTLILSQFLQHGLRDHCGAKYNLPEPSALKRKRYL